MQQNKNKYIKYEEIKIDKKNWKIENKYLNAYKWKLVTYRN